MEARLNLFTSQAAAKPVRHLIQSAHAVEGVSATTLELVNIRASQINGCGFCVDMHTKDGLAAGETVLRLNLIAAWREATVFTEAEKAALELTEEGTRLADRGQVSDEVWERAAEHYSDEQLAALVCAIAAINAFNRVNVITRQLAGDYQPGQFG